MPKIFSTNFLTIQQNYRLYFYKQGFANEGRHDSKSKLCFLFEKFHLVGGMMSKLLQLKCVMHRVGNSNASCAPDQVSMIFEKYSHFNDISLVFKAT